MVSFSENRKIPYRVILCKYNEISLKSSQYQKKIFQILIDSVKKICIRENLHLQSALNLKGRLLFFFNSEEIPAALFVFRHIIGFQSIAPAISVSRKYETLKHAFIDFALQVLQTGESFAIKFKSIVPYPIKAAKVKNDFYNLIRQEARVQNKKVSVKNKGATREFTIEIREKGTYLYVEDIPTLWGGLPIETSNSLLYPWDDTVEEQIPAKLLLRRGAIIAPVIFDNTRSSQTVTQTEYSLSSHSSLYDLAKYYSEELPVIILPVKNLIETLDSMIPADHSPYPYYYGCFLKLLEKIVLQSRDRATAFYGDRNLHFRGFISSLHTQMPSYLAMGQNLAILQFVPEAGFSFDDIQFIINEFRNQNNQFSFNKEVQLLQEKSLLNAQKSAIVSNSQVPSFLLQLTHGAILDGHFPTPEELAKVTSNPRIRKLISSIVHNKEIQMISGKILVKNKQ
ncbi:tRNA sulfurtransferase [Candidatus Lokiarchaeum ossiferum]|uniref:tRNA sulfurtransferase n=1 Tax=Candidatus Lokiarchaeum ossiferum TaxID=2951803 RepID=A0ABY6HW79_9ARCH|nr:tRNA sulfurtransferase [Candidatus Lokiarchaeum sp. B-35]